MNYTVFLIFIIISFLHPVHVSITNIDINTEESSIEFSTKVFQDDVVLFFEHFFDVELDLEDDSLFYREENKEVVEYFLLSVKFQFNEQHPDTLQLVNHYTEDSYADDSMVWLFFEGKLPGTGIKSLKIENTLLFELYEDQKNMVIVNYDDHQQGYMCTSEKPEVIIEF